MKKGILLFCVMFVLQVYSQSRFKRFLKLDSFKRTWVIFHVFKAKRAERVSHEAFRVSDSIRKTNALDRDVSGGQVDAFRHAYWTARLQQEIGKSAAISLGKAHEKDNYRMFKKSKLEDGIVPDKISSDMDLYNNNLGVKLVSKYGLKSRKKLIKRIIKAIKKGEMKIIKKDKKGNFLSCEGKIISKESLVGKWKNNKCLVDSNNK